MSKTFALQREESLADAFRRIAVDQLTRAAEVVADAELPPARRIHELRKRLKESRALLRLYRDALGDAFAERNRWYRDVGRAVAEYRDAAALVATLDALPRAMRREIGRWSMAKLRRRARARCQSLYENEAAVDALLRHLAVDIEEERRRTEALHLSGTADAVEAGLARTLSDACRHMDAAYADGMETAFHEWRKRVKDHWYHVQLFLPARPKLLSVREEALNQLSHRLGDHHDLAVVQGAIAEARFRKSGAARLASLVAQRQAAIAADAQPLARMLFAGRPRDEARQMLATWRAWRS